MLPRPLPACLLLAFLLALVAAPGAAQDGARPGEAAPGAVAHGAETLEPAPAVPLLAPLSHGDEVPLPELDARVPSPSRFLGYPLGSRFTHHARLVAYLEALAAASPRVSLWEYGESYEGRSLLLLAVTSPENMERLEEIRLRHMRLAAPTRRSEPEVEALVFTQPTVVWLGYGVHGNESSSAEAALAAAYVLAAAQGPWERWLREVVVLIDPLGNPDGRERYLAAYEQRRGVRPDAYPGAREHSEPWPGGRTNHYLIDLNRDWAWASQQETRQRLAAYRRWEPQVHVDFHEMASGSTYFFPPVTEPIHPAIDRRVLSWLETFGDGTAAAFDDLGWVYYNAQQFDLFYPGYGDSYPGLRAAAGMTYEMAGGGRAGQLLELPDGTLLTLADRVGRHLVSTLATVETAAKHRVGLLKDFVAARQAASNHLPQSILWEAGQPEARALVELLALHGIEVHQLAADAELVTSPGIGGTEQRRRFVAGTYVVSTAQPLASLVEALMKVRSPLPPDFVERQRQRLEESLPPEFYDVTAWALPLAFNVETWLIYGEAPAVAPVAPAAGRVVGRGDLGYLLRPQGLVGFRLLAALKAEGVRCRLALQGFTSDGERYPRGTVFVPRRGNPAELEDLLRELAAAEGVEVRRVASSQTEEGISLGSDDMVPVRPARLGLVLGPGVSPASAGSLWHLLDVEVGVPHTVLEPEALVEALADFDVLVLPDGSGYGEELGEKGAAALREWVRRGGVLVAVRGAVGWLEEEGLVSLETWTPEDEIPLDLGVARSEAYPESPLDIRPLHTPGAALATEMRTSHPLTAGLAAAPSVLFLGSTVLLPAAEPERNVVTAAFEDPVVSGFAWPEARERLAGALLVGEEPMGEGRIIAFAQEPAFRLFWRATMPLFLNAVLFAPSW